MGKTPFYQTLEGLLRGRPYEQDGNRLSIADCARVANALMLWLLALRDLSRSYDGLGRSYSHANLQRCADRLAGSDVQLIIAELKAITGQLRLWQPHQGCQSLRAFKAHFNQAYEASEITKPLMWPLLLQGYRCGYSPTWYRDVNTASQFLVRLTLRQVDWVTEANRDAYAQLEEEMRSWEYPSSLISDLRSIITDWCRTFPELGRFTHSTGATREVRRGKGKARKFMVMKPTDSGLFAFRRVTGYVDDRFVSETVKREDTDVEVNFVPKGIDKKRVVTPERTFAQYIQSAWAAAMVEWFESTPDMNIPIRNQERSRQLCLRASRSMDYATFDLSSASDTVTYRLMKPLLVGTPLHMLLLARTPNVHLDGYGVIRMEKMFPMGSICCFPMECLIFSACCKLACKQTGCRPKYLVYGDDIIIPAAAAECLKEILSELHFILNEDKSYGPYSQFLEACGMEAFDGADITPCRLPRRWDIVAIRGGKSPAALEAGIELCNRLYSYGLFEARRAVVAQLLAIQPIAFSVDPERGIYHPDPTNQHLKSRWNPNLQHLEYKVFETGIRFDPCSDVERQIEYIMLLEEYQYTKRKALKDPLDLIEVKAGPTRAVMKHSWRALDDLPVFRKEDWRRQENPLGF